MAGESACGAWIWACPGRSDRFPRMPWGPPCAVRGAESGSRSCVWARSITSPGTPPAWELPAPTSCAQAIWTRPAPSPRSATSFSACRAIPWPCAAGNAGSSAQRSVQARARPAATNPWCCTRTTMASPGNRWSCLPRRPTRLHGRITAFAGRMERWNRRWSSSPMVGSTCSCARHRIAITSPTAETGAEPGPIRHPRGSTPPSPCPRSCGSATVGSWPCGATPRRCQSSTTVPSWS